MPITVAPPRPGRARTALVVGEARFEEDHVHVGNDVMATAVTVRRDDESMGPPDAERRVRGTCTLWRQRSASSTPSRVVEDARVGLVSSDPEEAFPEPARRAIAGHWRTDDCLDADQLVNATSRRQAHLGSVDRLRRSSKTCRCRWERCGTGWASRDGRPSPTTSATSRG